MSETHATPVQSFSISRIFDAPRDRLWEAWTDPEALARWFGPKGTHGQVVRHDLRPGGVLHYFMDAPQSGRMWGRFLYREIEKPARLVWVQSFSDEQGEVARAPFANGTWPLEKLTTVTFEEVGQGTRVTLVWEPIAPSEAEQATFAAARQSMTEGWTGSFDQLAAYLSGAGAGGIAPRGEPSQEAGTRL